jgi:hypothetical protein
MGMGQRTACHVQVLCSIGRPHVRSLAIVCNEILYRQRCVSGRSGRGLIDSNLLQHKQRHFAGCYTPSDVCACSSYKYGYCIGLRGSFQGQETLPGCMLVCASEEYAYMQKSTPVISLQRLKPFHVCPMMLPLVSLVYALRPLIAKEMPQRWLRW